MNFGRRCVWLMGIKRALTMSHHPQADGQTEVLKQTLEIALTFLYKTILQ